MLITSKFRDFYDNCAAYGVDKTVRYNRELETLSHRSDSWKGDVMLNPNRKISSVMAACDGWGRRITSDGDMSAWLQDRITIEIAVLGFCGVLHRVVIVRKPYDQTKGYDLVRGTTRSRTIYFEKSTMPQEWFGKYRDYKTGQTLFEDFEKPISRENADPFITLNAPVFLAYDNCIVVNPCLEDLDFQKHKDGVTAFQEISAFISGTLNTANQMQHTASDQELIQAHGFDKHSFRKGKSK